MTFGNNSIFPFNSCSNNDLIKINNSDNCSPNIVSNSNNLPNHLISDHAIKVSNLNTEDSDCDINLSNLSSCEYYSCTRFQKLASNDNKQAKN